MPVTDVSRDFDTQTLTIVADFAAPVRCYGFADMWACNVELETRGVFRLADQLGVARYNRVGRHPPLRPEFASSAGCSGVRWR